MGPDFSPAQGRSYTARSYSPDLRMALNFIWIGFILIGFAVAAVKVMMGQTALFGQMLTGLFDMAKTGFDISLGLVGVHHEDRRAGRCHRGVRARCGALLPPHLPGNP
jgi:hypothetical protein